MKPNRRTNCSQTTNGFSLQQQKLGLGVFYSFGARLNERGECVEQRRVHIKKSIIHIFIDSLMAFVEWGLKELPFAQ